jgi:hypothetical protein
MEPALTPPEEKAIEFPDPIAESNPTPGAEAVPEAVHAGVIESPVSVTEP